MANRYNRVPSSVYSDEADEKESQAHVGYGRVCRSQTYLLVFSVWANILLFFSLVLALMRTKEIGLTSFDSLYSPAQDAVQRQDLVFNSSIGRSTTSYQGKPNDENNKLWQELHSSGVSRISADEAKPLVNMTLPIPDDDGQYVVELSVFHQLRCLDLLRQGIYGNIDMSDEDEDSGINHLDHCIDVIRQNLQCTADITPMTWMRDPSDKFRPHRATDVIHTCRNFTKIHEWALEHKMIVEFDEDVLVEDDPLGWGNITIGSS